MGENIDQHPNPKALYTVLMPGVTGLALHVTERPNSSEPDKIILCFDDTQRGHMFPGTITERRKDGFSFQNDNLGESWKFRVVTLRRFKHSVYKIVGNGEAIAAAMKTTEDLWEWYRKEFPLSSSF